MNQGVKNYINDLQRRSKRRHQRIDFTKLAKFMKPKPSVVKEKDPILDEPKPEIKRPPAEYGNKSPYNIATELHKES